MKKKWLSVLLAASMTVSLAACGSNDNNAVTNNENDAPQTDNAANTDQNQTPSTETAETTTTEGAENTTASARPDAPMGQLIIGTETDLEQDFYDANYNNAATNYKVCDLLHGRDTVVVTKDGEWIADPSVAASLESVDNEDGTKTHTITLVDGMVWSDGSPLTVKDYVFAIMLESSKEMMGVDNYPATNYTFIEGWDEFNAGDSETLKGLHMVDDKTLSITVKAEELPYHYDIAYAAVRPRPLAVIAPGCDVEETEDGVKITGEFTTDLLMETIANTDTGYRYNPKVTCGPYKLENYDASSRQGTLVVNDKYSGDANGVKPVIEKVIIKTVKTDTMMNELKAGTVDLLFQISGGDMIEAGLDLVDAGIAQKNTYFRYGYGKLQFDCSAFPTDSEKVRQAIAYCLDRNEFARQYSGGYATVVHAEYGLSQWEYTDSRDWIDENLNAYERDIEKAKALLVEDGWTLNSTGAEYADGDGTRYKEVDGELKPLVIEWCNSEGNPVSELLGTMLPESMAEAGMELRGTTVDLPTLFNGIDHLTETQYNMFNLGAGFSMQHSPWYYYSTDEQYMGNLNANWISDQELSDAAYALKSIPYDDKETWLTAWRNYMKVWNEKLPNVPLYSDEYHDFFNPKLQGWETSSIWDWASALTDAWVTE